MHFRIFGAAEHARIGAGPAACLADAHHQPQTDHRAGRQDHGARRVDTVQPGGRRLSSDLAEETVDSALGPPRASGSLEELPPHSSPFPPLPCPLLTRVWLGPGALGRFPSVRRAPELSVPPRGSLKGVPCPLKRSPRVPGSSGSVGRRPHAVRRPGALGPSCCCGLLDRRDGRGRAPGALGPSVCCGVMLSPFRRGGARSLSLMALRPGALGPLPVGWSPSSLSRRSPELSVPPRRSRRGRCFNSTSATNATRVTGAAGGPGANGMTGATSVTGASSMSGATGATGATGVTSKASATGAA